MQHATYADHYYSETKKDVIRANGSAVGLRRQSAEVFKYLAQHPDQVLSREDIQSKIWKHQSVTDDSLSQCVSEIRKAIDDHDRRILKTVPRRGYMLVADKPDALTTANQSEKPHPQTPPTLRKYWLSASLLAAALGLITLFSINTTSSTSATHTAENNTTVNAAIQGTPTVSVQIKGQGENYISTVATQARVALSKYKSVAVVTEATADFTIQLSASGSIEEKGLSLELISSNNNELVFAEILHPTIGPVTDTTESKARDTITLGSRIAGMIASPGGGAVSRHLLKTAQGKTANEITRSQCYAYSYGCTNCSGELDPITEVATECLANLLEEDPADARAWGLQSTLYAHQYLWSSALSEPARTSLEHRSHLTGLAIEAANKAEFYSDGTDTAVYWGMAQAYAASCQLDKLQTAVDRGLQINPDDPSLLGGFGSWVAYGGDWDKGVTMINKALEIEPKYYKRWWLFPIAKQHYARGEYEQALEVFQKAYNERNWLSHLQLAYTLPHLNRIEEAIVERKAFERLYPGATIENVLQFYKTYCFENSFLEKMKWALTKAGLPSRGSSDDLNDIRPTAAEIMKVNGFTTEYKDVGTGTPIVFVHGSISDYRAWSHYQNPVSENHRYISYSLRYAGSQDWPDQGEQYGIATDAEDLIAFIEAKNIGPVFTVSWSRGGRVSGLAALHRPDLFLGNVHFEPIVNVLGNTTDVTILKAKEQFFSRFDDSDIEFSSGKIEKGSAIILENVFELERGRFDTEIMPLRAMNRDAAKNMALQLSSEDHKELNCDKLNNTQIPTLVVLGEKTNDWWKHVVERYHECTPGSQLAIIDGVNHDGPIRKPEKLTELILQFVESHSTKNLLSQSPLISK